MKRIAHLLTLLMLAPVAVFADIAQPKREKTPKPTPGVSTSLYIKLDRNATEAVLRVPKSQIKQLRAELEQIDEGEDNTAAVQVPADSSLFSRTQTIVSGMFLSLALVFGGMWFVRSGKCSQAKGKALMIFTMATAAASVVYANIGPPPEARAITSALFTQGVHRYKQASGKIRIETMTEPHRDVVELVVPDTRGDNAGE